MCEEKKMVSKITKDDLLANGWTFNGWKDIHPFEKELLKDKLKFIITTEFNNYQFALLVVETGDMILIRNPETFETVKEIEKSVYGIVYSYAAK